MRIWAKMWLQNHLIKDTVIENYEADSRTHKIFGALEKVSTMWDLEKPIWLDSNVDEFKRHSKTRFTKDSFIEAVDFDYLEIEVIEEDY